MNASIVKVLEEERKRVEGQLEKLNTAIHALGGRVAKGLKASSSGPKRTMSAAGRARIAAAQRARWAKIKAAKKR